MTVLCLKCYWYDVDETPSENETCETRKWCLKFAVSYDYENDYFDQTGVGLYLLHESWLKPK